MAAWGWRKACTGATVAYPGSTMSRKPDPRLQRRANELIEPLVKSTVAEPGRGYFLSSIDLQRGLEVSEEDMQTLPPEFADMFGERRPG